MAGKTNPYDIELVSGYGISQQLTQQTFSAYRLHRS